MKRTAVLLVILLVLVGALTYALNSGFGMPAVPVAAPVKDKRENKAAELRVNTPPAEDKTESSAKAAERVAAIEPPTWDPEAEDWAAIKVVNSLNRPVPGASVELWALRSDKGGHLLWPGTKPIGKTDAKGLLRLPYFVWTAEKLKTTEVTAKIEHLTYATATAKFKVGSGEQVIVLERGGLLEVSGWIDDKYKIIDDVMPHLEHRTRLEPGDWMRPEGQRPSTHQVPDGYHSIYLSHKRPDGEYFSDVTTFEQKRGGVVTLHLKLHRGRLLRGQLSKNVARPVRDGMVRINLWDSGNRVLAIDRKLETPIQADGTFEFPSLPIGRGEILGIARGWVSKKISVKRGEETVFELQRVDAHEDVKEFELQMEKSSKFVLTVVTASGDPVPDATVTLWPNVHWGFGAAELFMASDYYTAKTDAQGRAVVKNLPADDHTVYEVQSARHALPINGAQGRVAVTRLVSGQDTIQRVVLVPKR